MLNFALSSAMTGFMVGVVLPAVWGVWILHDLAVQSATLPPGIGQCGTSALGIRFVAWCLILIGWPVGGLIGAAVGFAGGAIYRYIADMPPGDRD